MDRDRAESGSPAADVLIEPACFLSCFLASWSMTNLERASDLHRFVAVAPRFGASMRFRDSFRAMQRFNILFGIIRRDGATALSARGVHRGAVSSRPEAT
jgi:hypothetical protein